MALFAGIVYAYEYSLDRNKLLKESFYGFQKFDFSP